MSFGRNMMMRAVVIILMSLLALTQVAGAQEVTEYQPPENVEEIAGEISTAGSSTVAPITEAMIEDFAGVAPDVRISNQITGTGGGFELFCHGETAIQNASRFITQEEIEACQEAGIDYFVFNVALDGLAIVVNPENDFVECLTVEQVTQIWQVDSEVDSWADVDPSFPDEPIDLYGPDPDSGTFDYMAEVVEDTTGAEGLRDDYTASVDDNVLVEGVINSPNALAYFGFAYYEQNQDQLKVVEIDNGDGCVEPNLDTVVGGTYVPFARPLFIYVNADASSEPAVQEFLRFYLANSETVASGVGYFPLPESQLAEEQQQLEAAIAGEATPESQMATPAET
ncbi:MAG: PstS family phosphate ABC transporter substrate-binding protein [Chloroflexota bacterium]|nr:PstS family phosphate ABC transporter substrate-binding protein [Chloroflexota bacterium]